MKKDYWKQVHNRYKDTDWIHKPSLFAEFAITYFPPQGHIFDLGTGQGQDAFFFSKKGYSVTAIDVSEEAISYAKQSSDRKNITFEVMDFSEGFSCEDSTFDIVYSHLALHYFNKEKTERLFNDIYRALKPGGILAFLVNSTSDPEIQNLTPIEDGLYDFNGIKKRYFNENSTRKFTSNFKTIVLDNKGETYKDRAIGVTNLIRFIGQKK